MFPKIRDSVSLFFARLLLYKDVLKGINKTIPEKTILFKLVSELLSFLLVPPVQSLFFS